MPSATLASRGASANSHTGSPICESHALWGVDSLFSVCDSPGIPNVPLSTSQLEHSTQLEASRLSATLATTYELHTCHSAIVPSNFVSEVIRQVSFLLKCNWILFHLQDNMGFKVSGPTSTNKKLRISGALTSEVTALTLGGGHCTLTPALPCYRRAFKLNYIGTMFRLEGIQGGLQLTSIANLIPSYDRVLFF